eukprot:TRINITY_DN10833_c0_g1_i1.p1 TRINITY_DN10833_c0_g1~~TRINITY_DN10833_c0_g1_i1.p1  ORF type:complete len:577 (-),score=126.67 TRINITY_DN10833_c0_g1_i1:177-1907(-)
MVSTRILCSLVVALALVSAACANGPPGASASSGSAGSTSTGSSTAPAGTNTDIKGTGQVCGTRGAGPCPAGLYCVFSEHCGATDAGGTCWHKPTKEECNKAAVHTTEDKKQSVTGCDGKVYATACLAAVEGVSVRHHHSRESADIPEGTKWCAGPSNQPCPADQFCFHPSGNCGGDKKTQGVCKPRPKWCGRHIDPVMGCDQKLYNNECDAQKAGQDQMPTAGQECGGPLKLACGDDQYCDFSGNSRLTKCGEADSPGVCRTTPSLCGKDDKPVRGCDGKKYANACLARLHGVSIRAPISDEDKSTSTSPVGPGANGGPPPNGIGHTVHGFQRDQPENPADPHDPAGDWSSKEAWEHEKEGICGTPHQLTCTKGTFCQYPNHCGEQAWTKPGKCVVIPENCDPRTNTGEPVVGCDGKIYPSTCIAAAAGVAVKGPAAKPPPAGPAYPSTPQGSTLACFEDKNCPKGLICALKYPAGPGQPNDIGECEVPKNPVKKQHLHVLPLGAPCGQGIAKACQPALYCRLDIASGAVQGSCDATPAMGGAGVPYSRYTAHQRAAMAPGVTEQKPLEGAGAGVP